MSAVTLGLGLIIFSLGLLSWRRAGSSGYTSLPGSNYPEGNICVGLFANWFFGRCEVGRGSQRWAQLMAIIVGVSFHQDRAKGICKPPLLGL